MVDLKKHIVFDKELADKLSQVIHAFHHNEHGFCAIIGEVLEFEQRDLDVIVKIRLRRIGSKPAEKKLGYAVIVVLVGRERNENSDIY